MFFDTFLFLDFECGRAGYGYTRRREPENPGFFLYPDRELGLPRVRSPDCTRPDLRCVYGNASVDAIAVRKFR